MTDGSAELGIDQPTELVSAGQIDTGADGITDMQGRLQGKRFAAGHFLDDVVASSTEGCYYLLAVDVDMATVAGVEMSSWERGHGDVVMVPDLSTLRLLPWHPGTAMCAADLQWADGTPVAASPRRIRYEMGGSFMRVEAVKGECNLGQHEVAFRYTGLVAKADEHSICKLGAKEIAAQEGCSQSFMANYDEREGNSCHIHLSLRDEGGGPVFSGDGRHGFPVVFEQFLTGLLASLGELTLFLAPKVNSYKRFAEGSFAPTGLAWGHDNRTCTLRIVGRDPLALRVECRVPGADVNSYLGLAAMVAGGPHGVDSALELEPEFVGNPYASDKLRLPATLRDAAAADSVRYRGFERL